MRHFFDLRIKHKLTLICLITTTVALLVAGAGLVAYERIRFKMDLVYDVSGMVIGAVILVAILAAYLVESRLHRVITAPIADLVAFANRVTVDKDYEIRAVKRSDDELGRLFDSFNDMLSQIQTRDSALKSAPNNIEQQVEERTAKILQSSDLLDVLLENSPEFIYFKDSDSRFVRFSNAFLKQFHMPTIERLRGMTDFDIHPGERARQAYADEQEIIRTGVPIIGKIEKDVSIDGATKWISTTKMPWRDCTGAIIGTFGISKDITALKQTEAQLEQLHRQLLETSRQAGMAEVATNVLHNVGNALNSVNISATLVAEQMRQSKAANLAKVCVLLDSHQADLPAFLTTDPKGTKIPTYLATLSECLATERESAIAELTSLMKNIEHIKEIVAMQQSHGRISSIIDTVSVPDMIEDALRINASAPTGHDVAMLRDYQGHPVITTDKHKVIQILINLLRNAKNACDESGRTDKQIAVRTTSNNCCVRIAIIDNGIGIPAENLLRIFTHGFTTSKHGHSFGLHNGALAAKELGGSLIALSGGPGHGATFILELPLK